MRRALLISVLLLCCVAAVVGSNLSFKPETSLLPAAPASEFEVGALGRIEPQSRVIKVNAPSTMDPPVVEKLMVDVGDDVDAGEVLAILDSNRREQADLEERDQGARRP